MNAAAIRSHGTLDLQALLDRLGGVGLPLGDQPGRRQVLAAVRAVQHPAGRAHPQGGVRVGGG